jgi:hypothetical protein
MERWARANANLAEADRTRPPSRPDYSFHEDLKEADHIRYMAIIAFPWLNRDTGNVEWGVACKGCRRRFRRSRLEKGSDEHMKMRQETHRLYSKQDYLRHFFLFCSESTDDFFENFASKAAHGIYLRPSWDVPCHIAGDSEELEFRRWRKRQRLEKDDCGAVQPQAKRVSAGTERVIE